MRVIKRSGVSEEMLFDKVTARIKKLSDGQSEGFGLNVSPDKVAQKTFYEMFDGISTSKIDDLSADIAANMMTVDPDYETLAARILVSNMHKTYPRTFSESMKTITTVTDAIKEIAYRFDELIVPERDYLFGYFGLKTMQKVYLSPGETPQYMFLRVALGIHGDDFEKVKETYDLLSLKKFTHATPTMINAGMKMPQMSSCFLTSVEDSIDGIYKNIGKCAQISKHAGGIGIHVQDIRSKGSSIKGTNGTSDGIIPMLRVYNSTARYVNQCFRGDTLVYKYMGESYDLEKIIDCVPIEDIKEGDKVLTHDGSVQKVLKTHVRDASEVMLRVKTEYCENDECVFVTKNHVVFVESNDSEKTDFDEIEANKLVPFVHKMYYPESEEFAYVTEVIEIYQECKVYDLTVEKNHNYVTSIGLVHNSGRRKGSFAVYLEPWHPDIFDFLELRLNQGDEEARCRDLFTAMWIPNKFMRAVESGGDWALFDPSECPGLSDTYGSIFDDLYDKYLSEGRARKIVPALSIWQAIIKSQIETGTPYMLYKDTCNTRSNQRNLGTLKGSNLCAEVLEYTSKDEIAVCNLASLALPEYIKNNPDGFDFDELHRVTKVVTRNLNKVIDRNYYPVPEARESNMRHRPIGIGVQGLADVYILMGYPFDSEEASKLNTRIFETMYHAALEASVELAREDGCYRSFSGSPAFEGLLQFDLAGASKSFDWHYDWEYMRKAVRMSGLRNSLLIAPMPTATTSQVFGNNECFEPYTSNLYLRRTIAGEFVVVNKHLVRELQKLGLWNEDMKNEIIRHNGSVQSIQTIPDHVKKLFKTSWELSQKVLIDQARDRGYFVCQTQSLNLFVESPTIAKLSSMHMYAWKQGLKTGMYYLRTRPKAAPIQVTLEPVCLACSS